MAANRNAETITSTQTTMMVSKAMIGTGILILPQSIAQAVETPDGWITLLSGGLLAMLFGWIIALLSRRFPGRTFYQFNRDIVGRVLGALVTVVLSVYYLFSCGYLLRVMGEVVRMYLLDKTPIQIIMLVFMAVACYLTMAGIQPIARLTELFMPIIVIILTVFILFSLRDFELNNIRPVLAEGIMPIMKGLQPSILSYSGFEVMLFLTAFMSDSSKAVRCTFAGIGLTAVLYTAVVAVAIGSLTVEEVKTVTWPTMSVAMNIELPGGFFERFESLFTVLWVISMYTAFVMYHYGASLGLGQLFDKRFQGFALAALPVVYFIASWPNNLNRVFKLGDYLGYGSFCVFGVIPILLWIVAVARGIGDGQRKIRR